MANENTDELRRAAERGDVQAAFRLAMAYAQANKDRDALQWFRRGAELGDLRCMDLLAVRLHAGEPPMSHNRIEAVKWQCKAAELGHADAMYGLALSYEHGWGIERDLNAALHWYQKAGNAGCIGAMNNLGQKYATGTGVAKDFPAAAAWYKKAADLGNQAAAQSLREVSRSIARENKRGGWFSRLLSN